MLSKGLLIVLACTLAVAFVLVPALSLVGLLAFQESNIFQQIILLVLISLPAAAAFVVSQTIPDAHGKIRSITPLGQMPVIRVALAAVAAYLLSHLVCSLLGWNMLDWRMGNLLRQLEEIAQVPQDPATRSVLPGLFIIVGGLFSVLTGLTLLPVLLLGQVYTWHGYLLPRLAPLGRWQSYLLTGLLWGLTWAPVVYLRYRGLESTGEIAFLILRCVAMAVVLTAFIGEVLRLGHSLGLAAILLGSFAAHGLKSATSVWGFLFISPVEPWAGPMGLVNLAVWALLAVLAVRIIGPVQAAQPR